MKTRQLTLGLALVAIVGSVIFPHVEKETKKRLTKIHLLPLINHWLQLP